MRRRHGLSPHAAVFALVPSITPEGDGRDHFPPDLPTDHARRRQVSYSVQNLFSKARTVVT
jgi:hypothetical protein